MAVPTEALTLKFDPDELTLGELQILNTYSVDLFRAFVSRYGNWTEKQIDALTRREWRALHGEFYEKLLDVFVPKVNAPT